MINPTLKVLEMLQGDHSKNPSFQMVRDATEKLSSDEVLPLVYEQLRQLAKRRITAEFTKQSLQATDLVHEAYLRLKKSGSHGNWNNLNHFFGAASIAMRRILVERARRRKTSKRGGGGQQTPLTQIELIEKNMECDELDVIALDDAIESLAEKNYRVAKVVELRFFLGMTIKETADVLDVSTSTAELDWRYARSFLKIELSAS
ncbi:MAG: ECF-type sigma factor [Rubripirellula sp.]